MRWRLVLSHPSSRHPMTLTHFRQLYYNVWYAASCVCSRAVYDSGGITLGFDLRPTYDCYAKAKTAQRHLTSSIQELSNETSQLRYYTPLIREILTRRSNG